MGSNSVHMLVVRFYEGSLGTPIYSDKEAVRIGRSVFAGGDIDRDAIDRTVLAIRKFKGVAESMGAESIVACATCAAREAPNARELLDILEDHGIDLKIIPGAEEARLIRLGVVGPVAEERTLLIDIGGGSTEIAVADGREDLYLDSLKLGAVRMTYGTGIDQSDTVSPRRYDELRRHVDTQSYHSVGRVRILGFDRAIGSSGTLMALAGICAARRGDDDASYLRLDELTRLMKDVCAEDVEGRRKIPRLSASRAEIIIGGGAVAEELMTLFGIDRMEISPDGLREGMQLDWARRRGNGDIDVRESAVVSLASRCGVDMRHCRTVRRYASRLYDEMGEAGVLEPDDRWRALTGYECMIHSVGEFITFERSNIHSYTIISNAPMTGFDMEDIRALALMARFNHGPMPKKDSRMLDDVPAPDRSKLLQCAMIVRMADIMDRGRDASMERITVSSGEDVVTVDLRSDSDISMEVWKLRSTGKQFRKVFGKGLRVVFGPLRILFRTVLSKRPPLRSRRFNRGSEDSSNPDRHAADFQIGRRSRQIPTSLQPCPSCRFCIHQRTRRCR